MQGPKTFSSLVPFPGKLWENEHHQHEKIIQKRQYRLCKLGNPIKIKGEGNS